jgi:ribosome-binding ATPase
MGFSCGFVGLPNVGKSTLFNALTKAGAEAANFPFCTIEPNTGIVPVPDKRLDVLSEMHKSKKIVPAVMKFIDIAGLVGGASQGQGLGNKFLGHIRNVDAIAHVVRLFDDENVTHVSGKVDPVNDVETIITELALSDLEVVERRIERTNKKARSGDKDALKELEILKYFYDILADGSIPEYGENEDRNALLKELNLLSTLPAFICANVDENMLDDGIDEFIKGLPIYEFAKKNNMEIIPICAKLEEEIIELSPEDAKVFMEELSLTDSGLNKIIKTGYRILNYITFLTTGPDETRAWTIIRNTAAPQAAGKIHTDMERGFIRMEVVAYNDILEYGSEANAKSAGKMRIEGKDYIVQDGDVINVRFSV